MTATTANSSKNSTLFLKGSILLFGISIFTGCAKLPTNTEYPTEKIATGPGSEDMVLDTLTDKSNPRMLVSCSARRKNEPYHGEIWAVDLKTDQAHILPRQGEPSGISFHPHGIDLVKRSDGSVRLYVINHQDSLERQMIMEYIVMPDHILFEALHENELLTSPNDVCYDPNGGFYWSNDASNRKNAFIEPIFGIKGGYVGHSDKTGYAKSKNKFAYTNGIGVYNHDIYISTVIQSKVFRFKNQDIQAKPEQIVKLVGGDNITFLPDGKLLVTAHLRQIKFLKHMKNSEVKSPSVVYLVDPTNKSKKVIYADDGHIISAASTAIWFNGYLYVSQVFDGFIIKAKTGTL